MSSIKSSSTRPELILYKALKKAGLSVRRNCPDLPRKPDFAILSTKIAIFCDGDFWHGNNWKVRGYTCQRMEFKQYTKFWREKIKRNIERDRIVNCALKKQKWRVFRFWASDIERDPEKFANRVKKAHTKRFS